MRWRNNIEIEGLLFFNERIPDFLVTGCLSILPVDAHLLQKTDRH
jgi:hypothetical protein